MTREGRKAILATMLRHPMTEAEARYHEAVVEDCRVILGAGMELLELTIDQRATSAEIRARYQLGGAESTTVARGETVIEAHAALREALVVDRIRLGFAVATDPRNLDLAG